MEGLPGEEGTHFGTDDVHIVGTGDEEGAAESGTVDFLGPVVAEEGRVKSIVPGGVGTVGEEGDGGVVEGDLQMIGHSRLELQGGGAEDPGGQCDLLVVDP